MGRLTKFLFDRKTAVFLSGVMLHALAENTTWPFVTAPTPLPEIIQTLFKGLGEAFIIAVVLVIVFDEAAKRRFMQEVVKDVSAYILGRLLPPALSEYIIEQYLRADLVRTTWTITYTITEWPGQPEYNKLVTKSIYEMENRSLSPKDYPCTYEVEASLFPLIGRAEIVRVTGANLVNPKDGFNYPAPENPELKPLETPSNITFCHTVKLPVHTGPAYQFTIESVECFRDGSIVPFFATYPVLSTTLTVLYPVDRMNVFVDLSFGNIEGDQPRPVPGGKEWEFGSKPMLPGQGFTVRFARLPDTGTEAGT